MRNTFELSVDIKRVSYMKEPIVTQGDSVRFVLEILNDGEAYKLDEYSVFTLTSVRPDGQSVLIAGVKTSENIVEFDLGKTELGVVGVVKASAQLQSEGRTSTVPFSYKVIEDLSVEHVPSEDEKTIIELMLTDIASYKNEVDGKLILQDNEISEVDTRLTQQLADTATKLEVNLKASKTYVDDELSQKPNIVDVRMKEIPINTSDLSQSVLDAIQGGEGTSINVLSIPKDKSTTPKKTTFLKTSTNLFNKNDLSVGYNIGSTGELIESASHGTSGFIPCVPGGFYSYNRIAKFVWYDENYLLIAPRSQISPTQAYDNAYYMRVVIEMKNINNLVQLNEGKTLLPYEEYKTEFRKEENFIFPDKPNSDYFGRLVGDPEHIDFVWNERKLKIADRSTRLLFKGKSYLLPLQVVDLPFSGWHKIIYDTVDEKVELIRLSETVPEDKIAFGTVSGYRNLVNYIENYYIDGEDRAEHSKQDTPNGLFVAPDTPSGWYRSSKVQGYEAPSHYEDDITLGTIYDVYDRLVTDNPDYVTKTNRGKDATNIYPVYSYEFKPETVEAPLYENKLPKIIVFTSVHGEEKSSTVSLRNFMRDVCDNWQDDPLLEFIRFNVHLIIMPIVNPYGFVNYTRKNGNGVDLNRNNSYRWEASDNTDPEATTYKGTSALSEKESQYVRDIILENKDAIACFDYHTNGSSGSDYRSLFWHYLEDFRGVHGFDKMNAVAKYDISKITREAHKRYNIPNDSGFLGYISYNTSSSTIAAYAFSEGIPSMTIECTKKMVDEVFVYSAKTMQMCTEFIGNNILNTVRKCSN